MLKLFFNFLYMYATLELQFNDEYVITLLILSTGFFRISLLSMG